MNRALRNTRIVLTAVALHLCLGLAAVVVALVVVAVSPTAGRASRIAYAMPRPLTYTTKTSGAITT
jgi:hypothetical protein